MRINMAKLNLILTKRSCKITELINSVGIDAKTLSSILLSDDISPEKIHKICNFLKCKTDEISFDCGLLQTLKKEKDECIEGKLYEATQVKFTYSALDVKNYGLTENQIAHIFETSNIATLPISTAINTLVKIQNHFKCIDYVIDNANKKLDEDFIKTLYFILNEGTDSSDNSSIKEFFSYKKSNQFSPETESNKINDNENKLVSLLNCYNSLKTKNLGAIIKFLYYFVKIYPFDNYNDAIGRLITLKECLKNGIVPFYIDHKFDNEYKKCFKDWKSSSNILINLCKSGQESYLLLLSQFKSNK